MKSIRYLVTEFFILFVLLPISFAYPYPVLAKAILTLAGFIYVLVVLRNVEGLSFRVKKGMDWKAFWRRIMIIFIPLAVATGVFVYLDEPNNLFYVPRTNLKLFIMILFIYTFLSVWPQEVIYRTFFFKRYEMLFRSKALFIFINGIIFSLAHIFFRNTLVLILTFIGGVLFGLTYVRFRSTTLVSIEHSLYGCWLFTVGMGQMLAFPGMEQPQ